MTISRDTAKDWTTVSVEVTRMSLDVTDGVLDIVVVTIIVVGWIYPAMKIIKQRDRWLPQ